MRQLSTRYAAQHWFALNLNPWPLGMCSGLSIPATTATQLRAGLQSILPVPLASRAPHACLLPCALCLTSASCLAGALHLPSAGTHSRAPHPCLPLSSFPTGQLQLLQKLELRIKPSNADVQQNTWIRALSQKQMCFWWVVCGLAKVHKVFQLLSI